MTEEGSPERQGERYTRRRLLLGVAGGTLAAATHPGRRGDGRVATQETPTGNETATPTDEATPTDTPRAFRTETADVGERVAAGDLALVVRTVERRTLYWTFDLSLLGVGDKLFWRLR